jgi:hypothetical protein
LSTKLIDDLSKLDELEASLVDELSFDKKIAIAEKHFQLVQELRLLLATDQELSAHIVEDSLTLTPFK